MNPRQILAAAAVLLAVLARPAPAAELPGTVTLPTRLGFQALADRTAAAIAARNMLLVAKASASAAAADRGVAIPGNAVFLVFRNDYAVRMLAASVAAGFEAPMRLYVTEQADGTASLTYRKPSALFAPYETPALDELGRELDGVFATIAADAAGG